MSTTVHHHAQPHVIDTIHIFSPAELLRSNLPAHWRRSTQSTPVADREGVGYYVPAYSFSFDDPASGYHAYGNGDEVKYHRASLPRLLHGNNGMLIKSQAELNAGRDLLQQKACEICNATFGNLHFTRVDLVWQFRGDTAGFILAHRNARHPRIRRGASFYESRSMAFKGSQMRISIYDKSREKFKHDGDIVRVEVQLKGRVLKELLGNGDRVTKLDFNTCYQAYRRILLGFIPSPVTNVSTVAEFLSIAEREGWQSGGVPAFDLYTRELSPRQIRRIQKDMASCRPAVHKIDWSELLPADGPPTPIELISKP
jgi:hypothetical protein